MASNGSSTSSITHNAVPIVSTAEGNPHYRKKSSYSKRRHHQKEVQPGLFFLVSRDVKVCYGPYMVLGVMDYRTERLQGLACALGDAGGEVKLVPSYHVNEVRVWHLERNIFSCKITDLFHGGDGKLDPVCNAAEKAMDDSIRRAYFNLKFRYHVDECLLNLCPCHPPRHSNDSLTRVPCKKYWPQLNNPVEAGKDVASGN